MHQAFDFVFCPATDFIFCPATATYDPPYHDAPSLVCMCSSSSHRPRRHHHLVGAADDDHHSILFGNDQAAYTRPHRDELRELCLRPALLSQHGGDMGASRRLFRLSDQPLVGAGGTSAGKLQLHSHRPGAGQHLGVQQ